MRKTWFFFRKIGKYLINAFLGSSAYFEEYEKKLKCILAKKLFKYIFWVNVTSNGSELYSWASAVSLFNKCIVKCRILQLSLYSFCNAAITCDCACADKFEQLIILNARILFGYSSPAFIASWSLNKKWKVYKNKIEFCKLY